MRFGIEPISAINISHKMIVLLNRKKEFTQICNYDQLPTAKYQRFQALMV